MRLKVIKSRRVSVFYEISRVNPLDIFISSQEKEDSSSNLSEFNCPEILVTQQWIDKKGRAKKNFLIMQKMLEKFMVYAMKTTQQQANFPHLYTESVHIRAHTKKAVNICRLTTVLWEFFHLFIDTFFFTLFLIDVFCERV